MKIIKRSGTEVVFDIDKIVNAIRAANLEVEEGSRLTDRQVIYAAQNVAEACENAGHTVSVEEIQDLVEDEIMRLDCYEVARHYIIYRYVQSLKRQKNTTSSATTKRSSRRTPTRTRPSTPFSATTWPARSPRT